MGIKYFGCRPDVQPDELGEKFIDTSPQSFEEAAQDFFDLFIDGYESSGEIDGLINVRNETGDERCFVVYLHLESVATVAAINNIDRRETMRPVTWIPNTLFNLPTNVEGMSDRVLVSLAKKPFQTKPDILLAHYDFFREQWRTNLGQLEGVTHWMPLPDGPEDSNEAR